MREHTLTQQQLESVKQVVLSDTWKGFVAFYTFIRNLPFPTHALTWIKTLYEERDKELARIQRETEDDKRRGIDSGEKYWQVRLINESFRGSTKTTVLTETFTAYQIGLHPERSNLFVQASDVSARQHASNVADIIEHNPLWRIFFPHVVPDKEKGWGANGYWVKDESRGEEWVRIRHGDPSLLGDSYGAAIVVGKHPTGVFVIDDINDDKNTESPALQEDVNRILRETLFPMMEGAHYCLFNQTPWNKKDALAVTKATGVWRHIKTPVLVPDDDGELIEVTDDAGNVLYSVVGRLTWPEKFDKRMVALKYRESGFIGFCRMYLCSVEQVEGLVLKADWLRRYPAEDIHRTWPRIFGIDYASTLDKQRRKGRDYFALAVGALIPSGGVVLITGKVAHVSQGEALRLVESWAAEHNPSLICVETYGSGDEFYQALLANTNLPVWPDKGPKGKAHRYEKVLGPTFELGRAWMRDSVSDEFLKTFEQQWKEWPATEHDDALDAVYEMIVAAQKVGNIAGPDQDLVEPTIERMRAEAAHPNPWAFRRH